MVSRIKIVIIVFLLLGIVSCTSSETAEPSAADTTSGKLEVHGAWGRSSPKVAQNGAFYMQVINNTSEDDELQSARSDACEVVELHEMYMIENDVMGMRPVEGGVIPIPAGETVELKVGGLHVMCLGKKADFNVGDTYAVKLQFAKAGEMEVAVEIREMGEMPAGNMEGKQSGEGGGMGEGMGEGGKSGNGG
jgi:copper(I)-binding protein